MNIFVITCIDIRYKPERKHTSEWYCSLDIAKKAVEHNSGDMCEGATNHWALIEEITEGFPFVVAEHWFEWIGDFEDGGYKPATKPEFSDGVCNWGIG